MFRMGDEERQKEAEKTKESQNSSQVESETAESQSQSSSSKIQFVPVYPSDCASGTPIGFKILYPDGTEAAMPSEEDLRKLNAKQAEGGDKEEAQAPKQPQRNDEAQAPKPPQRYDESLKQPRVSFDKRRDRESAEKSRGKLIRELDMK